MPYLDKEKQKQAKNEYYLRNKQTVIDRNQIRRLERRQWFNNIIDPLSCVACGESSNECLDFHHLVPEEKTAGVSELLSNLRSKDSILNEIRKCVVLCANCHRKHHANKLSLELNESHLTKA